MKKTKANRPRVVTKGGKKSPKDGVTKPVKTAFQKRLEKWPPPAYPATG